MRLQSRLQDFHYAMHLLRRSKLAMFGIILVVTILIVTTFAPLIAPYGPETRVWEEKLEPPSAHHYFGTDNDGGDIFSRVLYGYRLDLSISLTVVILAAGIGTIFGAVAAFLGSKSDELIMRITDVFLAIPSLILAMAIGAVMGRTPVNLAIALTITRWPSYTRLMRGQVLVEKQKLYVDAARASGGGPLRILFKHVLPNSIYPVVVNGTLDLGAVILSVAALSFLGFGVEPGAAELGRMVADGAQFIFTYPWVVTFPGLAILLASLGLNLVGDGLRDILDPRLRR